MDEITFSVLRIVVSACAAIITVVVVPYLKTLQSDKRYAAVIDIVKVAVEAAEQTMEGGAVKKEYVIEFVREWLAKEGIQITHDQLDALIESTVWSVKEAKK